MGPVAGILLAATGRLPWRTARLLNDAYQRGIPAGKAPLLVDHEHPLVDQGARRHHRAPHHHPARLPPFGERINGERTGEAIPIVLNVVIFRNADAQLTTAGTYIDMAARLLEPSLLVLTLLAIRERVKR